MSDYEEFADCWAIGIVTAEEFQYRPSPEPVRDWGEKGNNFDDMYLAWLESGRGSGGERHGWLKWWAWNCLVEIGEPSPKFEESYGWGKADLVAHRLGYVVECGDTSPERVLPALQSRRWSAFVVIPYPYWSRDMGQVDYRGWIFRLGVIGQPTLRK